MLTILISEEDRKIKELVGNLLRQEGYAIPEDWDKQSNVVKIAQNETVHDLDSLKDKVIAMEEALYKDKYGVLYKSVVEAVERPLIEHVLKRTEGNQFRAARILGINRNTMRAKIKKLGINLEK